MRTSMFRFVAPAVFLSTLTLAACSGGSGGDTTTTTTSATSTTSSSTTTTTSTTAPETTTTAGPTGPTSPINGMVVEDPDLLDRGALVLKIDNHVNARPQSGLAYADAVIELMVEGTTRFAAVFHAGDAEVVGPIRSARPTDGQLARLFDAPLLMSGGQDWVLSTIRGTGTSLIGEVGGGVTFRSSSRRRPHNLYGNTIAARERAESIGVAGDPPQPLWSFGEMPSGAEPATEVHLPFVSGLVVDWTWDGERYLKATNGAPHNWLLADGETEQIWAETLVVLEMRTYNQAPPPEGGVAKAVESVGSGAAYVFADGRVVSGTWERAALDETFTLTDESGDEMVVPPGHLWISFFDSDRRVSWNE